MEFFGIAMQEWVGYAAMVAILISFLMKNIRHLRMVNALGSLLFVAYAFVLEPISKPIAIANSVFFCVNMYYLFVKKTK